MQAEKQIIDGRFEVQSALGAGGMGTVLLCNQIGFDRLVAVKILRSEHTDVDAEARLRFEREAQALSLLKHKNIVSLYGYGKHGDEYYIAMEYVAGSSLSSMLGQSQPLAIDFVVDMAKQVCDALVCAHAHGFIHRDIKPNNIIVTADGVVKLIDFGLMKLSAKASIKDQQLTEAGTAVGSVLYMSPEQCVGKTTDERSDLYALGCVMHHCLTGKPPYSGHHSVAVMHQHCEDDMPRLDFFLPQGLKLDDVQKIIDAATAKDPAMRYQSAQAMLDDLRRIEQDQAPLASVKLKDKPRVQPARTGRSQILAFAIGGLLLAGGAILFGTKFSTTDTERKYAALQLEYDRLQTLSRSTRDLPELIRLHRLLVDNLLARAKFTIEPSIGDMVAKEAEQLLSFELSAEQIDASRATAQAKLVATCTTLNPELRLKFADRFAHMVHDLTLKYKGPNETRKQLLAGARSVLLAAPSPHDSEWYASYAGIGAQYAVCTEVDCDIAGMQQTMTDLLKVVRDVKPARILLVPTLVHLYYYKSLSLGDRDSGDLDIAIGILTDPRMRVELNWWRQGALGLIDALYIAQRPEDSERVFNLLKKHVYDDGAGRVVLAEAELHRAIGRGDLEGALAKARVARRINAENDVARRPTILSGLEESVILLTLGRRDEARAVADEMKQLIRDKGEQEYYDQSYFGAVDYIARYLAAAGYDSLAEKVTSSWFNIHHEQELSRRLHVAAGPIGRYAPRFAFVMATLPKELKAQSEGNVVVQASCLDILAWSAEGMGRHADAIRLLNQSIDLIKKTPGAEALAKTIRLQLANLKEQ